jgi:acetyltransferase (GNAT) family protein
MHQINRITEDQATAVMELWDRMCRSVPDGGPLEPAGRSNIERYLQIASWHRDTFCLVAVADGGEPVGFVVGRLDIGDGLLPGLAGEIHELYVVPEAADAAGLRVTLARQAVDRLRKCGAGTIRKLTAADDPESAALWQAEGFEPDMICLSLYRL